MREIILTLLFAFTFCHQITTVKAQVFRHLTVQSGLAQNTVFSIAQDKKGFMWFGTPNGLSRYDSRTFKTYRSDPEKSTSISSDYVAKVFCDSRGTLWLGTGAGLNKYDPATDSFKKFHHEPSNKNSLSNNRIKSIFEDAQGNLWVGTYDGLNRMSIDDESKGFERYLTSEDLNVVEQVIVYDISEDSQRRIWVGTSQGLIRLSENLTDTKYKKILVDGSIHSNPTVLAVKVDKKNNIWVSKRTGEVFRFDIKEEKAYPIDKITAPEKNMYWQVHQIIVDNKERLWMATKYGLFSLDTKTMQVNSYFNDRNDSKSIGDNDLYTIFQDRQGLLWTGSYYGGVDYMNPSLSPYRILPDIAAGQYKSPDLINNIGKSPNGQIWFNSTRFGMVKYDKINNTYFPLTALSKQYSGIVSFLFDEDDILWMGLYSGLLVKYNIKTKELKEYSLNNDQIGLKRIPTRISSLLKDARTGQIWVGTNHGILQFDKSNASFRQYFRDTKFNPDNISVTYLLEDYRHNLWIGTNRGVYLLESKSNKIKWITTEIRPDLWPFKGGVNQIHEDQAGNIWLGTFYEGLQKYDSVTSTFRKLKDIDLLKNNNITNILTDNSGNLWLSDDNGLIRFNPKTRSLQ